MSRYRQTMREALEKVYESDAYDNNRYMMKKYGSQILARPDNSNTKDGKDHVYAPNAQIATQLYKQGKKVYREESDHEVSMARGELEAIADKVSQLAGALQGKSEEGNPLEAWVQSNITKAKDYINSVSDYLTYDPSMKQNEELEEAKIISDISGVGINVIKKEVMPFNVKVGRVGPGMDSDYEVEFTGSEPNLIKYAKKHLDFDGNNFSQLKKHLAMEETEVNEVNIKKVDGKKGFDFKGQFITDPTMDPSGRFDVDPKKYYKLNDKQIKDLKEEVNEKTYGWTLVSKAKDLAKKFKDNITKAVAEIEKLEKGLSKNSTVAAELRKYNENLEEKYTVVITKKDGSTMELGRYNTPAEAQRYVDMYGKGAKVKKEEVELDEIDEKISDIFKANKEGESIDDIAKRLKLSTSMVKKLIGEAIDDEDKEKDVSKETDTDKIKLAKEKDTDALEKQLIAAQGQINILKQKLENEKNKTIKPEPNPETGEVPLTIGIAHAEFKKEKEKKEVKEDISEKAMTDREKRLQRAKDMIKYYDAQKKAALKGKNKDLAKKMLKNDTEIKEVSDRLKLKVLKKKIKQYKDKVFKKTMSTVKSPLFADKEIEEALEIKEFTSQMIDRLKKSFSTAPKKISPEQANKLSKHLDRIDLNDLRKLVKANIPFVSTVD